MRIGLSVMVLSLMGCGGSIFGFDDPVTTLDPPPGVFNDVLTVTMTTDRPSNIVYTLDGSDPTKSKKKIEAPSPVTLELTATTKLTFFADANGKTEEVRQVDYIRAGGVKGTASGVIVVDTIALDHGLALFLDNAQTTYPAVTEKTEVPFTITGLTSGQHRLRAMADRDDDGNFIPVLDLSSETYSFQIDLNDPFKSSVENVRLYLGASADGLCTLRGNITVPDAALGESVSISALGGDAFGAGTDPSALLAMLQDGYQVFARDGTDVYPYAITDLEPGMYIPVPLRTTFGSGGLGLNLIANILSPVRCRAGEVKTNHFQFGVASLSGSITLTPEEPAGGFVWGIVAAKQTTLLNGIQVLLMPVLFSSEKDGAHTTQYAGVGLRKGGFSVRVFTSLDEENPLTGALSWAVNPMSQLPSHASITVGSSDIVQDFTFPEPLEPPEPPQP